MTTRQPACPAFLSVLAFLSFHSGSANASSVATTGANLLKAQVGARTQAMGGAGTALPGDLSGLLANPSLLVSVGGRALMLTHWPGIADMRTEYASYSIPLGGLGIWAGSVLFRTLPDVDNEVPGETLDEIHRIPGVRDARSVRLG